MVPTTKLLMRATALSSARALNVRVMSSSRKVSRGIPQATSGPPLARIVGTASWLPETCKNSSRDEGVRKTQAISLYVLCGNHGLESGTEAARFWTWRTIGRYNRTRAKHQGAAGLLRT